MSDAERGYALFETPVGTCGVAWGARGLVGLQLPEGAAEATRARLARRFPGFREVPPPPLVQGWLEEIGGLLRGGRSKLSDVVLDMAGVPEFHRRVYALARRIPPGVTLTYGQIAARLGAPGAARAVGQALGRNPFAIVVPCHRVLAAGGKTGGFSARGGIDTKLRLLAIERARGPLLVPPGDPLADALADDCPPPPAAPTAQAHPTLPATSPPSAVPARSALVRPAPGAVVRARRARVAARPVSPASPAPAPTARATAPAATVPLDPAAALAHLRACDPVLGRLIDAVGPFGLRVDETPTLFGALAEAIVYQQLTAKAAATIFGRVQALFLRDPQRVPAPPRRGSGGGAASAPRDRPAGAYPTPRQILRVSDEKLRGAGLSRPKLLALRDLARRTEGGELPTIEAARLLPDEAIIEALTQVRGVGRWTAQMLLMFRLGRPDVLPSADYGVRKGFALTFRKRILPTPEQIDKHGARWQPYRSVASWYLWRAVERAAARRGEKAG